MGVDTPLVSTYRSLTIALSGVVRYTYNQMVVGLLTSKALSEPDADRVFQALADATRRDILARAIQREQSVSALARRYEMSLRP